MPAGQLNDVIRYVRRLASPWETNAPSDSELLGRFTTDRDELAFEGLLRRHGSMVFGVCRRILGNEADAEDAFQAVFFVLARKACSLRRHGPVGGWLHGVAHNIAIKARAMRRKRRAKEREAMAARPAVTADVWPELCGILDEELKQLPTKYREPIVLCDLEGKTIREAARQLGWPQGTIASRLARGRALLAGRLRRRGLAFSAGALATALTQQASGRGLPAPLITATLRAVTAFAGGQTASAVVSVKVASLAEEAVKSMLLQKLQLVVAIAVLAFVAVTGVVATSGLPAASQETTRPDDGNRAAANAKEPTKADVFGDPLPQKALARLGSIRLRHGDHLGQVRFSADGKGLLTAGRDGYLRVWDAAAGKELRRLGHAIEPDLRPGCRTWLFGGCRADFVVAGYARTGFVFSADGRSAALAELDGTVSIWDVAAGKECCRLDETQKQGGVFGLGLSRDGTQLVSRGKDETLILWDARTGRELRRLPTGPASKARGSISFGIGGESVEQYVFSADGKRLASIDIADKQNIVLQVWDVAAGKELWRAVDTSAAGLSPASFSADGTSLVRLASDKSVRVHDAASGKELRRVAQTPADVFPTWGALAPDSRLLAVQTAEGVVLLYDLKAGKIMRTLGKKGMARYGSGSCTAIAFSPDGKTLAQGVDFNSVQLWDLETGKAHEWKGAGHRGAIAAVAVSANSKEVTSVAWDTLRVWDSATGRERRRSPVPESTGLVLSADGRLLAACADDGVMVHEAFGGKKVCHLRPADLPPGHHIRTARFSADGRRVASASTSLQQRSRWLLHVWDVATGKQRRQISGETWMGNWPPDSDRLLVDYDLSPDGALLLTLSSEAAAPKPGVPIATEFVMRLWDVDSGAEVVKVESEEPFRACAFSADGRSVAIATRDRLAVYEVASGKERVRFKGAAWKLALSRDGRLLASADGSTVSLWDVRRGTAICPLAGHQAHVDALTFAPDGKFLVSASADSTALIWDVARFALPPKPANLDAEQVEALWNDLASEDAGRAFKAIVTFGAAPAQTVPWLKSRLKPVATPDAERIAELIARLDSDDFAVRNTAAKELEKLGELASLALRKALEGETSIEARRRIETLLGAGKPGHALPAEELRLLRAVEVLEQAATADARVLLEMLAKGAAGARLTRHASSALERLVR